ncbi:MAG: DUF3015 family protein [Proteobacteria bacterium]|nr:DUF3015 family protein [Pseudomonadota bacterium]
MNIRNILLALTSTAVLASASYGAGAKKKVAPAKKPTEAAGSAVDGAASGTDKGIDAAAGAAESSTKPTAEHRSPYGMAGCGLGALIIKSPSKGPQIGASFLNMTGVQTSGISSGTSNCKMSKDDLAIREQEVFMEVNLASVAKDAAAGQGEHLTAFAEILGCSHGEDLKVFSSLSQSKFDAIFKAQDSKSVLSNYREMIKADRQLAKSCVRA